MDYSVLLTVGIASVIGILFILVVAKMIIDKKRGKSSCSCGCGGCAMRDACHNRNKNEN